VIVSVVCCSNSVKECDFATCIQEAINANADVQDGSDIDLEHYLCSQMKPYLNQYMCVCVVESTKLRLLKLIFV
jgi:hypothetical protein